ncbi:MAG: response regulator [Thermodesulfobacteriota bacterium]
MNILVVDDSEFARHRISSKLQAAGHAVVEADGGIAALEKLRTLSVQAATIDLLMPDMDGIELIRRIKASHPDIYVIALTADVQQAARKEAIDAGADQFFPKTRLDEVVSAIAALQERERLLTALTESDRQAFAELINQSMNRAASTLSELLAKPVILKIPEFDLMSATSLTSFFQNELVEVGVTVRQRFSGPMSGISAIVFTTAHAIYLVRALVGTKVELGKLSSAEQSVLTEMGNVVLNAAISVLADLGEGRTRISLPDLNMNLNGEEAARLLLTHITGNEKAFVFVSRLTIGDMELVSYLILLMSESEIHLLLDRVRSRQKAKPA